MRDTLSTLVVGADGIVTCLWTEVIDLSALGSLSIRRASAVEFDEQRQLWVVEVPGTGEIFADVSRERCLEFEREWFAERIGSRTLQSCLLCSGRTSVYGERGSDLGSGGLPHGMMAWRPSAS